MNKIMLAGCALLGLLMLAGCSHAPPSCHGPMTALNAGKWTPTPQDLGQ